MPTNCSFVLFCLLIFLERSLRRSYSIVRLYSQNSDECFIVLSGETILSLTLIERLPANKISVSSRSLYLIWSDSKLSIVSIVEYWCARLCSRIAIRQYNSRSATRNPLLPYLKTDDRWIQNFFARDSCYVVVLLHQSLHQIIFLLLMPTSRKCWESSPSRR